MQKERGAVIIEQRFGNETRRYRRKKGVGVLDGCCNIPIRVLADCDAEGSITPVRFRLETADYRMHTVHIAQIVSRQTVQYVGVEAFVFLCKAVMDDRERLFELRYTVRAHRWVLLRMVY